MYRILICDDQKDIVNALKIYLTPEGYDLYEAYNARRRWSCAGKHRWS